MDTLSGSLVTLRPVRDEDLEYLASLRNDMRTQARGQRFPPCHTAAVVRKRNEESQGNPLKGLWCIEAKGGQLVGTVDYHEYAPRLGAIMGIVTGMEHWGKGYAREAMEMVMRFLFEERGLYLVNLWTTSWNVRMVGLAEKLGFRIAIRERESRTLEGSIFDGLFMDILREEYYETRKRASDLPLLK